MLADRVKEWTQEWKREGFNEGFGKGQIFLTQRMIEKRFGPLNTEQIARLQASDPEILLQRLLTASSLEDVLGD